MRIQEAHGFTLIEMVIVITLIGLLMAVVIANLPETEPELVEIKMQSLAGKLETYRIAHGFYPSEALGLAAVLDTSAPTRPRRAGESDDDRKSPLVDPWGMPFRYRAPGEHNKSSYDLWSFGPNRRDDAGFGDDIINWRDTP